MCRALGLNILACLCPPLAVCIAKGCTSHLFANCCLTLFAWLPGCLHACCIVNEEKKRYGPPTVIKVEQNVAPVAAQPTSVHINLTNTSGGGGGMAGGDQDRQQGYYPAAPPPYVHSSPSNPYYPPGAPPASSVEMKHMA